MIWSTIASGPGSRPRPQQRGDEGQADALAERIGLEFALEELRGVIDQFKDSGE